MDSDLLMPQGVHKTPTIGWHSADPSLKPWVQDEAERRGITIRELLDEVVGAYRKRRETATAPSSTHTGSTSDDGVSACTVCGAPLSQEFSGAGFTDHGEDTAA
jgi:hypothetical protein